MDVKDLDPLTREYRRKGFVIIESFFVSDQVADIQSELGRYIECIIPRIGTERVIFELGDEKKIRNILDMHRHSEFFAGLAKTPFILEMCRAFLADEPVLINVEKFMKPARVGSVVPFHQDNAYFNLVPDAALTIWVALEASTKENGCVRYLPGTHVQGNRPHKPSGIRGNSREVIEVSTEESESETCAEVPAGGAIVHHCNVLHRSEPNRSNKPRPGLLMVYQGANCRIDDAAMKRYASKLMYWLSVKWNKALRRP